MRYLILSDIHANRAGLDAVLADAAGRYETIVNCGDVVGYGPDPNAALEFARDKCAAVVRGNHDRAVAGLADLEWFNTVARRSVEWTVDALRPGGLEWLAALPHGPVEHDGFTLVHGAPFDEDEYMVETWDIREAAPFLTTGVTFFGHTHIQCAFEVHRNGVRVLNQDTFKVEETSAYLINPGSVGQPRDGDPRAGYALYDTETRVVALRRIGYDIDQTYDRIMAAGLPEVLGLRLYRGA